MKYIIGLIFFAGIVYGGYSIVNNKEKLPETNEAPVNTEVSSTTSNEVTSTTTSNTKKAGFTLSDVAVHKDATSCWSIVEGKVYNLTEWIGKHPGGDKAILSICGKDGTTNFMKKHAESEKAKEQLPNFLIGDLITE